MDKMLGGWCRTRNVVCLLIVFLVVRVLLTAVNTSLSSLAGITIKTPKQQQKISFQVRDVKSHKHNPNRDNIQVKASATVIVNDLIGEITLSRADFDAVSARGEAHDNERRSPSVDQRNQRSQYGDDARRAQISKEDLAAGSKRNSYVDVNEFLMKHLSRKPDLGTGAIEPVDDANKRKSSSGSNASLFRLITSSKTQLRKRRVECPDDLMLVITVFSSPHNFEMRCAIRETWGTAVQKTGLKTRLFFVLAQPKSHVLSDELTTLLAKERQRYMDILQFDFIDSHENLTLKSINALKWVENNCRRTQFMLKTDEDVFINVPNLLHELAATAQARFIMGSLIEKGRPLRDRRMRYYTPPELYRGDTYPDYMSGTAYVISGDLLRDLKIAVENAKLFWLEDVYITGMCAKLASATLINNQKFSSSDSLIDPCQMRFLISRHGMTVDSLRHAWQVMYNYGADCSDTRKSRLLN